MTQYKYDEDKILDEMKRYVDSTYSEHYSGQTGVQTLDLIIASGHGVGFCVGDIIKYASRYGKKGGHNRKDLLKIIHYGMFLLHIHDTYIEPNYTSGVRDDGERKVRESEKEKK